VRRYLSGNRTGARWADISTNVKMPDGSKMPKPSLTLTLHKLYQKGDLELPIRFPRTGVQVRYRLRQGAYWKADLQPGPDEDLVSVVNIAGPQSSGPELWRWKRTKLGGETLTRVKGPSGRTLTP
jgi:hypothetical protein